MLKIGDMILLDKETNMVEYWNPFEEYRDIKTFVGKQTYYILAPPNNHNETYIWRFRIRATNNNKMVLNTTIYSDNEDPCIDIYIENNIGKINYVNNCCYHNGKNIVRWTIDIMKHLGCTKCILVDQAEKKCNKRNYKNYVSLSLIHKLRKGKTYYEEFDFIPYNKNNRNYTSNKIIELNNYITELKKLKWTQFNIQNEKWSEFRNFYENFYESPFSAFKQLNEGSCGIFYDILYLLYQPEQPSYNILCNVSSLISKSVWMKLL